MWQTVRDFITGNQLIMMLLYYLAIALIFVTIYYFVSKDHSGAKSHGRKTVTNLDTYENKIILFNNFPQCRMHYLKYDLAPFIVFVIGALCTLASFSTRFPLDPEIQRNLLYAGLIMIGLCIVYYAVRFLAGGGLKGLNRMSDSSHLQYIKPEYETHNVYESEDGVTKGRLVGSYTTETNGATESNAVTFLLKIVAFVFKILTLIDFAVVHMIDRFIGTVKFAIFGSVVKNKLLSDARSAYEKFLLNDDVNIGCFNPSRDGIVPIAPYGSAEYNDLPKSIISDLLRTSMVNVKNGTKKFVFCGKVSSDHVLVTNVTNYETSFTMNGNVRHLLSCDKGKLIVDPDAETVMPMLYDMDLYMQFFMGENYDEAVDIIRFGATRAQYCWLKNLAATEKDDRQVQLICFDQGGKSHYVKAKLRDITLNEQTESYTIGAHTELDTKKTLRAAQAKRSLGSLIWMLIPLGILILEMIYLLVLRR